MVNLLTYLMIQLNWIGVQISNTVTSLIDEICHNGAYEFLSVYTFSDQKLIGQLSKTDDL